MELAKSVPPLYGLDWRDQREDALATLDELGDPYVLTASDADSRVAIDYGVTGAPETYVIDKEGAIRYKEVGQLTPENMETRIMPLVRQLNK